MIKKSIAGVGGNWDGTESACGSIKSHNQTTSQGVFFKMMCMECANLCAK
jgi:hypothetical protein